MATTVRELYEQYGGFWGEHPDFPAAEWQHEVANDGTRKGYWEWVKAKIEASDEDDPDEE